MKNLVKLLLLVTVLTCGIVSCSGSKKQVTGHESRKNITYNKNENITSVELSFIENYYTEGLLGGYSSSSPYSNPYPVYINNEQIIGTSSVYKKTFNTYLNPVKLKYTLDGELIDINEYIPTIDFPVMDTISISNQSSINFIGNPLLSDETVNLFVALNVNSEKKLIGSTTNFQNNNINLNTSILQNYLNQEIVFTLERFHSYSLKESNISYMVWKKFFVTN